MILYSLVVFLYGLIIKAFSPFNTKAALWTIGRKNWQAELKIKSADLIEKKVVWIHCASYGEFEQGRPLMELLKKQKPDIKILLTFFSPSGYESFKKWSGADVILYLPIDSDYNAKRFLDIVKPQAVVFVKYEFWLHYLLEIKKRNIPNYLVSATFKPHHPFFKWYGGVFRQSLLSFTWMFLQDQNSKNLLSRIGIKHCSVAGDTRFDRVIQIKDSQADVEGIAEFKGSNQLLVAGSTWQNDEKMLFAAISVLKEKGIKLVLAPHEVSDNRIKNVCEQFEKLNISYCLFTTGIESSADVLVLNTIGQLSKVYRYANYAYVGGGLSGGLHNTLEPAVFGVPVFISGNKYHKYNEAVDMLGIGVAFIVKSTGELVSKINALQSDPSKVVEINKKLQDYFNENKGVSSKILNQLLPSIS